jgi:phosphatidylinositol glycan class M
MHLSRIHRIFESHAFIVGLLLRVILMIVLPLLLDDGVLLQGVKYTDIDYDVFTDAARYVARGESPYKRHTYRYTPFLAVILSYGSQVDTVHQGSSHLDGTRPWSWRCCLFGWWKSERYFGRFLFCLADAICGLIILQLRRRHRHAKDRGKETFPSSNLQDALWWLYNPLPINICTRGSAESFVVLLLVLGTVSLALAPVKGPTKSRLWGKAMLAGMMHGMAIHSKLYPIIYTLSFMSHFAKQEDDEYNNNHNSDMSRNHRWKVEMETINDGQYDMSNESKLYPFPWLKPRRFMRLVKLWLSRLFSPTPILFLLTSMMTFGGFTFLAIYLYGSKALEEGLLYHFSRVDHRHNYSMFWYWIYLARSRLAKTGGDIALSSLSTLGKSMMVPQVILLLYSSLGIAPFDLSFALFVQTFFFVAMNKVITAQYFTWYLVLLPLCSERIDWSSRDMFAAMAMLGMSIFVWLCSAFYLEIKGMGVHAYVWMSSILFYFANVNILRVILKNYQGFGNVPKEKSL